MREQQNSQMREAYQIKVRGHLDLEWKDWFDGFIISPQANGETILVGNVEDQAALHSLLAKIRDLGLSLLSVNRTESETDQSQQNT